jgi:Protein of unknown function (DUF1569)
MRSFWDPAAREDICQRLERLTPDAKARWGKFTVAQMVAHLNDAMRMASGELPVKSKKLPLRYWPLKQLVIYVLPFPKGAPTAPELLARCTNADLSAEQQEFRKLAESVAAKSSSDRWPEHPAFGTLTWKAWGVLAFRHADHHLRQFGV